MLTEIRKELASVLFDIGAIRFGSFRLKLHEKNPAAPLSPIYIDLRILRSFPNALDTAIDVYKELTRGLKFDVYADVPTAATPIVAILSHETRIPMISPRQDKKKHGMKRPIDGDYSHGQVALLIDDLITLAESKLEVISVLEENGIIVNDIAVLVDREQGGVEVMQKHGYACHVSFTLKELLKFYLNSGKIGHDQYERIIFYLAGNLA